MILPRFQTGHVATEPAEGAATPYVIIEGNGTSTRCAGARVPATRMVVIPGAADGLRTCVDVAVYLAWFYRERAENCRVLILSRREPIPAQFGIEAHADDMIRAVEQLGFGPAVWECLSAAGPIGQWIAVKRPDLVQGLILSSSYDHVAGRTKKVIEQWLNLARHGAGSDPFWSLIEPKYRPPAEVLAGVDPTMLEGVARPQSPERLQRILEELIDLDQRELVTRITCPTSVIGGEDDRSAPAEGQRQMAARIPNSQVQLDAGYGHFNDMENPAYQQSVVKHAQRMAAASAQCQVTDSVKLS